MPYLPGIFFKMCKDIYWYTVEIRGKKGQKTGKNLIVYR